MNFNTPIPHANQPKYHEGSPMRSVRDADSNAKMWQRVKTNQGQSNVSISALQQLQRQVAQLRRRIVGGGGGVTGWHFADKFEVNPTLDYDKGSVIHIQPTSTLVTTGIKDLAHPTNPVVKSSPGWWEAMQDVPAKVTISSVDYWNLPQAPMPVDTNMDDPANFWMSIGTTGLCDQQGNYLG